MVVGAAGVKAVAGGGADHVSVVWEYSPAWVTQGGDPRGRSRKGY